MYAIRSRCIYSRRISGAFGISKMKYADCCSIWRSGYFQAIQYRELISSTGHVEGNGVPLLHLHAGGSLHKRKSSKSFVNDLLIWFAYCFTPYQDYFTHTTATSILMLEETRGKPATFAELYQLNSLIYDWRHIDEPHEICSELQAKSQHVCEATWRAPPTTYSE